MANCLTYDASRLTTRTLNATPNGIDRIDLLLAEHFLSRENAHALMFGFGGPSVFRGDIFPHPKYILNEVWRENVPARDDLVLLEALTTFLLDKRPQSSFASPLFSWSNSRRRLVGPARSLLTYAPLRGGDPARVVPENSLYINASHFPIEWQSHVAWLEARPDVKPVLFVHDLLPIERPELFWPAEPRRHQERLNFLARRGAAALVTSHHVEEAVARHLLEAGRGDFPIFRAPPPVLADFFNRPPADEGLSAARYFVICGTIEPRKNHQLLIEVWRRLRRAFGTNAPKLIVIGKRGWKCDHIVEGLQSPELRGSVVVLPGVPTSIYKRLLAQALALLAPALAEGFGLPIGEALALGVPVISSDIEGHKEYKAEPILMINPRNVEQWEQAIVEMARSQSNERFARSPATLRTEADYFKELDCFFEEHL